MFRGLRTAVVAAVVALGGASAGQAAPIGTFSLVDPFGTGDLLTIDVSNLAGSGVLFSAVSVFFCDGSVVPADGASLGFLAGDGSVRTCSGPLTPSPDGAFGDGSVMPGDGLQLVDSLFELPTSGFAFLSMRVASTRGGSVPFLVDPLDLSCDPAAETGCTNFIYEGTVSVVAEPASTLLLAGGLGALAAAGRRRRRAV